LVGGQHIDVRAPPDLDGRELRHMHELKTGRLLGAAVAARHRRRTYVSTFGLVRARELACESHALARVALAQAPGDTSTLQLIADYVLTRRA